jgi:T-complex protein 1 subunit theta
MGLHPSEIVAGYTKASQKALAILEELASTKVENLGDLTGVGKVLKTVIASKQYGWEDLLGPLVAEACLQVTSKNKNNFSVDNVRVAKNFGRRNFRHKTGERFCDDQRF